MRKTAAGWFFTVTGILACPCHLVITLPLAVAVLSGTALGGWMATHEGTIATGAAIYFVGALVVGFTLLSLRRANQAGSTCALPAADAAPEASWPIGASRHADSRTSAHTDDGDVALDCCRPAQLPLSRRRSLASDRSLPPEYPSSSSHAETIRPADPTEPWAGTRARTGGNV